MNHNTLQVTDARFSIKTKQGDKVLLDDISLTATSKEMVAMMGPSGAGKTTLLDLMTMRLSGGKSSGSVMLNGQAMTMRLFRQHAAICEQYDAHWAFLTCREVMKYSAELCVKAAKERQERVHSIMEHLGLLECADTKVGNMFLKGMSGGQKKRLSLAVALLKGPAVLFLDEPTSGLDAASTESCMRYLKDMASQASIIIVATIHQPSTQVFMEFSKVVFLANGRLAFSGSPGTVAEHCKDIGHPLPDMTNPADYFIQLINSEFAGRDQVDNIVDAWRAKRFGGVVGKPSQDGAHLAPERRPGLCSQSMTVLRRHGLLSVRDPTLYIGRMLVFILANSFFAIVYIKARSREQQYATARYFLVSWFVAVPTMLSVVVVYAVNEEFNLVKKEIANGLVTSKAFLVAKTLLQVPYMFLLTIFAMAIPAYGIGNFNIRGAPLMLLLYTATVWSFECMGEALGIGLKNPLIGMLGSVGIWFTAFLFSGNFLDPSFVIWPFRVFCSILPLRWAVQGMNYLETHGTSWQGAEFTPDGGFMCPGLGRLECFGRTGDQVRESLSLTFANLSSEDTVLTDLAYIAIIAAAFKVVAVVVFILQTRWVRPVQPLEKKAVAAEGPSTSEEAPAGSLSEILSF